MDQNLCFYTYVFTKSINFSIRRLFKFHALNYVSFMCISLCANLFSLFGDIFTKTTRDISFKVGASSHLTVCTHNRGCIYSHGKLRGVTLSIYFELYRQFVHMHLTDGKCNYMHAIYISSIKGPTYNRKIFAGQSVSLQIRTKNGTVVHSICNELQQEVKATIERFQFK